MATKVSAAEAFRQTAMTNGKLKAKLPADEDIIKKVRQLSGSTSFDSKHLAWYKSMAKKGQLAKKGRAAAKAN